MTTIQDTIRNYLGKKDMPGVFETQAFVGMIETGEATFDDFEAVGGMTLAAAVANSKRHMDEAREEG